LAFTPDGKTLVALGDSGNGLRLWDAEGGKELHEGPPDALRKDGRFVTSYGVALVYAGLGDNEPALTWLDHACEEKFQWLVWLRLDPRWVRLRSDPRYGHLLHRIGIPE